jgi:hypothetical protein
MAGSGALEWIPTISMQLWGILVFSLYLTLQSPHCMEYRLETVDGF